MYHNGRSAWPSSASSTVLHWHVNDFIIIVIYYYCYAELYMNIIIISYLNEMKQNNMMSLFIKYSGSDAAYREQNVRIYIVVT